MPESFDGTWWSVILPPSWSGHADGECGTFQSSPPLGALQISSARRDIGPVTDDDLRDFAAERITSGIRPENAAYGPFVGFSVEYRKGQHFWKEWWLRSEGLMIYATYNIKGRDFLEKEDVERILSSLKPTSGA